MVEMETLVPRSPSSSAASNNTVTQYHSPVVIGPSSRWTSLVTGAVLLLRMCQDSRGCSWLPITLRHGPRSSAPKPRPAIEIKPSASEVSGIAPFGKDIQIVMRRTANRHLQENPCERTAERMRRQGSPRTSSTSSTFASPEEAPTHHSSVPVVHVSQKTRRSRITRRSASRNASTNRAATLCRRAASKSIITFLSLAACARRADSFCSSSCRSTSRPAFRNCPSIPRRCAALRSCSGCSSRIVRAIIGRPEPSRGPRGRRRWCP